MGKDNKYLAPPENFISPLAMLGWLRHCFNYLTTGFLIKIKPHS